MNQYAVVFYPKGDLEKIQNFREKYDPQFHVIPPHITLVSPFSDIPEEKITQDLTEVTKKIHAFPIYLSGFMKSFDDYLFLLVKEGKDEITKLNEMLYSGVLADKVTNDISFIPHITLGEFTRKKELYEKAFAEAKSLGIDVNCMFDSISLIKGDGVNPAKTIATFELE